jgi:hypothetical protein
MTAVDAPSFASFKAEMQLPAYHFIQQKLTLAA